MTQLSDDELRSMLEDRANRHAIDLHAVAEVARHDAMTSARTVGARRRIRPILAGLGSVAAIALALLVVVVPLSLRPASSAEPSALASRTVSPASSAEAPSLSAEPGPAMVESMSAQGLAEWLASAGTAAPGRVVLLAGELIRDPSVDCIASHPDCAPTIVRGVSTTIVVVPVGDIGPGPWSGGDRLAGTFALRATSRRWAGTAPILEFLAMVRPADGHLAWRVPELEALDPADGPDWFLVAGWMVRTPAHPCPSPASEYGCPTDDLLTPDRVQPTHADGSSELPEVALSLRAGTYDEFAPDPMPDSAGVVPRAGSFLVQRISVPPCGPLADCYAGPEHRRWLVRARVDPIVDSVPLTPRPTPAPAAGRYPGGIPKAIDGEPVLIDLDAQARWRDATDATPFLVGGWFDSHVINACSGGIGPSDPNPLAARGCPRYDVDGLPGRPIYPESIAMPEGDGPIILRVHTRDPGAATCIAEYIDACWRRVVVDGVAWFGDAATAAVPLGPRQAISRATGVFIMERRPQPDRTEYAVTEDLFTIPLSCPTPWPTLLFSIHGDPRYGLVAVFPDPESRERFERSMSPEAAGACLGSAIERPAAPRWVGHENVLVLAFANDAFSTQLESVLRAPQPDQAAVSMTEPELDRTLETITDYLVSRAAGALEHAWGERLVDPVFDDPGGPRDVVADSYAAWTLDVFRRHTASALVGRIEPLDDEPTRARIGPSAWRLLKEAGVTRSRIFRVTYPGATDPGLVLEEFLVIQMPESLFRDWQLIRITGEPYPQVRTELAPGPIPAVPSSAADDARDVPCLPVGEECP